MSDAENSTTEETSVEEAATDESRPVPSVARYEPLGMVGNPFQSKGDEGESIGAALEIRAAANALLKALLTAAREDNPKPILVRKAAGIPAYYPLRATGDTEAILAQDETLGLLHAYIQMYLMRHGRVRATLRILGERLSFRHFETTLALLIQDALDNPDTTLASYQVLGPDALDAFKESFEADPESVALEYFGDMIVERRGDLSEAAEMRTADIDPDVDGEDDGTPEIDDSLGTAVGVEDDRASGPESMRDTDGDPGPSEDGSDEEEPEEIDEITPIADYVVEHVRVHRSPVVARALRVYKDRGLAAMASEFRITKAPRKTLKALLNVARLQFDDVVLIFDGFDNWNTVPPDLRAKIAASLSDIRWTSDGLGIFVVMVNRDATPEVEEPFAAGTQVDWDFPGLVPMEESPGALLPDVVDSWLSSATIPGSEPLTMAHPLLVSLRETAGDDLQKFVDLASAAIEDAADRGVPLDEEARNAALEAAAD